MLLKKKKKEEKKRKFSVQVELESKSATDSNI